jgi:septal ring factor EnvC (AmiA/AmiB activator)
MKFLFLLVLFSVLSQSWANECEANLARSVRERNDVEQRVKEVQKLNSELLKLTQENQAALETSNQKLQTIKNELDKANQDLNTCETKNKGCQKKKRPTIEGLKEIGTWSELVKSKIT